MFAIAITMVSLFRTMLIAMEELRVTIFLTVQAAFATSCNSPSMEILVNFHFLHPAGAIIAPLLLFVTFLKQDSGGNALMCICKAAYTGQLKCAVYTD